MEPLLSVVVTSYTMDRFKDICDLFRSLEEQTYRLLEVVFVADQLDELEIRAEKFLAKSRIPRFKVVVHKGEAGVNVCRNVGIRASAGRVVAIVDDDVVLPSDWASEMVKSYDDDSVIAVTGPADPLWEDPETMSWFPKELYFIWGCTVWDWDEVKDIRNVGGMNCSFKRDVLFRAGLYLPGLGPRGGEERIGWFHPSGEEVEICLRLRKVAADGARIVYNPAVRAYHKVQKSRFHWGFVFNRAFRFGYTKAYLEQIFRRDFEGEDFLNLERDHLRSILWRTPMTFAKDLVKEPLIALRRFTVVFVGVLSTSLGYYLYALRPSRFGPAGL